MKPRDAHSPLRALVVEDDPSLCDLLTQQLEKAGIDAHGVASSEEALRWIDKNGAPNVISTDLGLPVSSGFRLCEQLRSRADMSGVPIAVVSARTEVQDQAHAMELGADAFIEKPLGLRRYAETVTKLLTPNASRTMLFVP